LFRTLRSLAGGLAAAIVLVGLGVAFDASGSPKTKRGAALERAMKAELQLTREATSLERGLASLERERASLEYAETVLEHRGSESVRRLDAYRVSREAREKQARRRARSLYKLARGGVLRLVFEDISEEEERAEDRETARSRAADRVTRGRTLRWLVLHDLQELSVHRRAEDRARAELLAASREAAALDALSVIQTMEEQSLGALGQGLDPALASIHRKRRRLERRLSSSQARDRERGALKRTLERERRTLRRHRGLDLLERDSLARPVRGKIVGEYGSYVDRILRVPMQRNGVELRAGRSESVLALAPGEVALVGELPGFDKVVVLDHGGGYLSLTGRLLAVEVSEGDTLAAGAPLGRAAPKGVDDGLGRSVYLELRHGERPIDPRPYLRRSKG
jgi:septal ring factor EnvC (AmiA/AmiB activator)